MQTLNRTNIASVIKSIGLVSQVLNCVSTPTPTPQKIQPHLYLYTWTMNLRNKGPEWLCDDYKEARPVTVDLFIRCSILFEFFPQTLSFDFSSFFPPLPDSKWDRIKRSTTPLLSRYGISWSKNPRYCTHRFHPLKACCGRLNLHLHLQDQLAHDDPHHKEEND